jgi:branched-subunit amino acid transport protein
MNVILLIIGMMVVTFFPRYLPFITISKWNPPRFVKRFLKFIPYAALGALILPGAVMAVPGYPSAAIIGIIAAILCSWFRKEIILTVIISVSATFMVLFLSGF